MNRLESGAWPIAERMPPLSEDVVQIWRVDLNDVRASAARQAWLLSLLSPFERARVDRYKSGVGLADLAREQFIAARGTLRLLLGHALGIEPGAVQLETGPYGKPALAGSTLPVAFNVAHSRDMILIALGTCGSIGIDVEYVDVAVDAVELARDNFTPLEARAIASPLTREERARAFYACWTRKEAVAKASGLGLSLPLNSFETFVTQGQSVNASPSWSQAIFTAAKHPSITLDRTDKNYYFVQLPMAQEFAGAVAVEVSYLKTRIGFKVDLNAFSTSIWDNALKT